MTDLIAAVCWDEIKRFLDKEEFLAYFQHIEELTQQLESIVRSDRPNERAFDTFFEDVEEFGYQMATRRAPIESLLSLCSELRNYLVNRLYQLYPPHDYDRDLFGRILEVSTVITDYTNRLVCGYNKRQNDEMNRLYVQQRNVVLDALPLSVVVYDAEGRCVFANRRSYEDNNTVPGDVIGKLRDELVDKYNDIPDPADLWERVRAGERVKIRNESYEDNELMSNEQEMIPLQNEQGEFTGMVTLCYPPISEKERLYHMQRQFSFVLNSMNSGLLVLNQESTIAAFNKKAEEIFGLQAERVLGTSLQDLLPKAESEGQQALHEMLEQGRPVRDIERTVKMGERNLTLRVSGNPICNDTGQPVGYILILDDLTELLTMREAVMRNEKFALIGQFAAGIAHEIRNPLTTVFGFLQLYASGDVPHESFLELTKTLLIPELARANSILSDFLMVSKPQAPQRSRVDTGTFLIDVVRLVESEANLRGVILQAEIPVNLPALMLDVQQMKQVFLNLCKNAFDVTPPGGRLILRVRVEEGEVRIYVMDEGPGIVARDLSRIFEPFYTTKEHGTGLGLPISHRIVEGHGGTIKVRSFQGVGTTFIICLPNPIS
ncbi:MAG: ATP-binding protein [Tumebacillaceae bacterium]